MPEPVDAAGAASAGELAAEGEGEADGAALLGEAPA